MTSGLNGEYQAHHILEQRHMKLWGYNLKERLNVPSQILSRKEHQQITNALRNELPFKRRFLKQEVWKGYQKVYSEHPKYLESIEHYFIE